MNTGKLSSRHGQHFALASLALAMAWAGTAQGAEYWLCAKKTTVTMPGGVIVPMWGYALDTAGFAGGCAAAASVPGPALPVPVGQGLIVHLRNVDLPEPTSLVIPGQVTSMLPVRHTDPAFTGRVRSFAAEAAVGGDQTYTWANLKPGTYLYQSGTHPQVQVQMGLYGAMTQDASVGQAYPGVSYSSQVNLLFSEIDPVLHAAVAAGRYGQPAPALLPPGLTAADYPSSTIDYAPQYFLINGAVHTGIAGSPNVAAGNAGQTTLLRLLNAGLQSRSPMLQGMYMRLMAEDGNPSPYVREQYSAFLPAQKTMDVVITPATAATYPIYDRRLAMTNPGPSGSTAGGMLAYLAVAGAAGGTPLAGNDAYATNEDTALAVVIPGVLGNDDAGTTATRLSGPSHGSLSLLADGSFTYTPASNYNGADSFSYQALSGGGVPSLPATVSLTVNPVNDPPNAGNDAYSVAAGTTLTVGAPGVLGNDTDVDGQSLTAVNATALAGRSALDPNGSFTYTAPNTAGINSFTYQASDGTSTSTAATVSISVVANQAPVAVNDSFSAPRRTVATGYVAVVLNVLANDTDANGNIAPATVVIATQPNKGGTVTVNANGTVSYTPKRNFRGTENFGYTVKDSAGAVSNIATVRVNVQ